MVEYPWKRDQLIYYIRLLADPAYTRRVWINHEFPPGIEFDCFSYLLNFFFDDTSLARSREHSVRKIVKTDEEWHSVKRVTDAVDKVHKKVGSDAPDEEYLDAPEWEDVVEGAKAALATLEPNSQ